MQLRVAQLLCGRPRRGGLLRRGRAAGAMARPLDLGPGADGDRDCGHDRENPGASRESDSHRLPYRQSRWTTQEAGVCHAGWRHPPTALGVDFRALTKDEEGRGMVRKLATMAIAVLALAAPAAAGAATPDGFTAPGYVDTTLAGGEPLVLDDTVHNSIIYTSHEGTTH